MKGITWRTGASLAAVVSAIALAPGVGAAASDRLTLREARGAAREAVLGHATYRVIHRPSPLRARSCWRVSKQAVRCSFEVTVGYECFLSGAPPPGALCTAVVGARRWVVQVRAGRSGRGPTARILSVASGPAGAGELASFGTG